MITNPSEIPFLQIGKNFPTIEQKEVIREYEVNEKLFRGKHDELFVTAYNNKYNPNLKEKIDKIVNFPAAVSRAFTDLLFGDFPDFVVTDAQEGWLKEFIKRNKLKTMLPEAGDAQSAYGVTVLQVWVRNKKAYVTAIPVKQWFPVVSDDPKQAYDAHVTGWFEEKDVNVQGRIKRKRTFHADIYFTDAIYHYDYEMENDMIVAVSEREATEDISEIGEFFIFPVQNLTVVGDWKGISDYADCMSLFEALDKRLSQYDRILDKHADPTLMGDPAFTKGIYLEDGSLSGRYFEKNEYLEYTPDMTKPEYLVWDAKLDATDNFIATIMNMLYLTTDTSPALFAQYQNGQIPSGGAFKKMLIRTMARKNRKALQWEEALDKIVSLCYYLENGEWINVDTVFKEGLPIDKYEQAQIDRMNSAGKQVQSIWSMLYDSGLRDEALQEEYDRILQEMAIQQVDKGGMNDTAGVANDGNSQAGTSSK